MVKLNIMSFVKAQFSQSDITRTSDSTYFVDIARVKKFILTRDLNNSN